MRYGGMNFLAIRDFRKMGLIGFTRTSCIDAMVNMDIKYVFLNDGNILLATDPNSMLYLPGRDVLNFSHDIDPDLSQCQSFQVCAT